jgi:hypothetical protein
VAAHQDVYTEARYLIAGSVMSMRNQKWFSVDDIDARASIHPSLEPELESLNAMDVCETHFSAVGGEKYRLDDGYFGDFRKVGGYFNVVYDGNFRKINREFGEEDLEELKKDVDVVDILS